MCGRFALYSPAEKIKLQFDVSELPDIIPRYNIAPSQDILILMQLPDLEIRGEFFIWGLIPYFAKDKKFSPPLLNARSETVAIKPAFSRAFKSKRAIVVMNGFFEWKKNGEIKQPYYISQTNHELIAIAALWDSWHSKEGEVVHSCCLLTTKANEFMAPVHDRMPVILGAEQQKIWMDNSQFDKETLLSILNPYQKNDLQQFPVTPKMNNWRFTSDDAIKPIS